MRKISLFWKHLLPWSEHLPSSTWNKTSKVWWSIMYMTISMTIHWSTSYVYACEFVNDNLKLCGLIRRTQTHPSPPFSFPFTLSPPPFNPPKHSIDCYLKRSCVGNKHVSQTTPNCITIQKLLEFMIKINRVNAAVWDRYKMQCTNDPLPHIHHNKEASFAILFPVTRL